MYKVYFDINDDFGKPKNNIFKCKIGDMVLEVNNMTGFPMLPLNNEPKCFKLKNLVLIASDYDKNVGNIYWNSYTLKPRDIVKMVNYMINSGDWDIQEGPREQFIKFANDQYFDINDISTCYN